MPRSDASIPPLVETQRDFFATGATRPVEWRRYRLRALGEEVERRADDLLAALAEDLGKPPLEAYTAEIHFLLSEIRLFVRRLPRWVRPRRASTPFYFQPARSEIRREPFGSTVIVAPWNYPLQLSLSPLVGAVGAGNVAVLKPSELAPATAGRLAEIVESVFDPGHVVVVQGDADTGRTLQEQPFDFWFYTGGERVGRLYAEAAAKRLAPAVLELGGKCPCVVDEDVDLDLAISRITAAKFANAGQICIAPDFVLVPESMRETFVERTAAVLRDRYGDGLSPDLARIVNDAHYERLQGLVDPGAIRIGEDDPGNRYLAPRVQLSDWEAPAMEEEIFGPILPVIPYRELGETLERLARLPSPLALYAFSRRRERLERMAAAVPSGSVCFNDALKQAANLALPFGGVGPSGMGRYRGRAGFESFTWERAVARRWFCRDPFEIVPPYGDRLKWVRRVLR